MIDTAALLDHYRITREQLIDLAILVGTDFNDGIKGIGPKKALKLVSDYGSIEKMPPEIKDALAPLAGSIREIFMQPDVTGDYEVQFRQPDIDAILHFLCDEREFSRERVEAALKRTYQSGSLF